MGSTLRLRPYQDDAADFLYENDRAMILAPVGAGKTAITLTAMREMLRDGLVKRWLVLAPKRVCTDVWPLEVPKWAPDLQLLTAIGSRQQREKAFGDKEAQIIVINYDNIQTIGDLSGFDGLVCDELTRLKNPGGKRFKALLKLIDAFKIRWGLTGSFTSNGLEDVFGQCKVIDQKLLGRAKGAFLQQYFHCINRDFGQWTPAEGALEQVMARIKPATYVLDAGEYKDKLPPCHVIEMRAALDDRGPYEKMKTEFIARLGEVEITALNAGAVTNKLQQMASGFVYDSYTYASDEPGKFVTSKTPIWFSSHKFDLLDEVIEENQHANTIIVYNYLEELAELRRRYPHAQVIDDPDAIKRWNDGKIELLLIHPKSAGHGLNLQFGGCKMIFVSLPWSLELYEQTVGRLHRSGQTRDVWVYILLTQQTIDERIWAALHEKRLISETGLQELKNG
jgi:SNF2 family DNA or RNA helicase